MADLLPQKIEVVKHSPYVYSTMFYCKNSHDLLNTHTFHDVNPNISSGVEKFISPYKIHWQYTVGE